jgi:N-acetylneuraminate synthase
MHCGDTITCHDVRRIRPGYGLSPKYLDEIIGRRVAKDVERGDRVSWDILIDESNK